MCGEPIPEGRMVCYGCENMEPSFSTVEVSMYIDKISDAKEFVELVSKCGFDVIAKSGRFAVNAKDVMSLFTLDLTKTITVAFYGYIPYEVREGVKKFIVI